MVKGALAKRGSLLVSNIYKLLLLDIGIDIVIDIVIVIGIVVVIVISIGTGIGPVPPASFQYLHSTSSSSFQIPTYTPSGPIPQMATAIKRLAVIYD